MSLNAFEWFSLTMMPIFCFSVNDILIRIWRQLDENHDPRRFVQIHPSVKSGTKVWSTILYHSKSILVSLTGSFTCQHYVQEIFKPVVTPFQNQFYNKAMIDVILFQHP
ncbi:hypothetical protein TNCT_137681 [Trichonephila clavata]|uniref:Uncharacterized protein n=1 Tax=Trichonephila clavata TaxID=2740835 RepID=A0A8X6LIY5_TRICU|nr:hypothetical protein TNCT_137681 [Trichonephila clavata]